MKPRPRWLSNKTVEGKLAVTDWLPLWGGRNLYLIYIISSARLRHTVCKCTLAVSLVFWNLQARPKNLMCSMPVHCIIQKHLITNKCTKRVFFITCNILLHVSTLLGHLQGELSAVVTLWLHFILELLIAYCVAFWRRELSAVPACKPGPQRVRASSTQYTVNSSTIKCNHSVTTAESSPWRWPSRVETCRSVLQVMRKNPLCICWCLMFFVRPKNVQNHVPPFFLVEF
jgi:hypothetical protein